jgi:hypothetical protein
MYSKQLRSESDLGRVFSSGVRVGKVLYGLGVFAFAFIPKGTPLGRIQGRIINDPNYGSDYCINAGENKVLEPGPPFCYLNHSCEPNCQLMQYVREEYNAEGETLEVGELSENDMDFEEDDEEAEYYTDAEPLDDDDCFYGDGAAAEIEDAVEEYDEEAEEEEEGDEADMQFEDNSDGELWVEAVRDIMPGEELTIDYAWPADREEKCLCGTPNCRGWIVDPAELHLLQGK